MTEKEMMTTREVAEYFKVTLPAVQKWRHRNTGPPFTIVSSNCALYKRKDVMAWKKKRAENGGQWPKNKDIDPYGIKASMQLVKDMCEVNIDKELDDAPMEEYREREAEEFRIFKRRAQKIRKKFK